MVYEKYVENVKKVMENANKSAFEKEEHLAYQVDIRGEGEGAFYIELLNGTVHVQPYEYYDHDVLFTTSQEVLDNILSSKVTIADAIASGNLTYHGTYEDALKFDQLKPLKKEEEAGKSSTTTVEAENIEKKASKKSASKKTESQKKETASKKSTGTKAEEKKAEVSVTEEVKKDEEPKKVEIAMEKEVAAASISAQSVEEKKEEKKANTKVKTEKKTSNKKAK